MNLESNAAGGLCEGAMRNPLLSGWSLDACGLRDLVLPTCLPKPSKA